MNKLVLANNSQDILQPGEYLVNVGQFTNTQVGFVSSVTGSITPTTYQGYEIFTIYTEGTTQSFFLVMGNVSYSTITMYRHDLNKTVTFNRESWNGSYTEFRTYSGSNQNIFLSSDVGNTVKIVISPAD